MKSVACFALGTAHLYLVADAFYVDGARVAFFSAWMLFWFGLSLRYAGALK